MGNKLGLLLAALRKERIDLHTGRPWTQKKLAQETGLSRKVISDIERGERQIDNETLTRLADVFQLNQVERQHFWEVAYDLQGFLFDQTDHVVDERPYLAEMIDAIANTHGPALLYDGLYQLLAANKAWLKLSGLEECPLPSKINMLTLFFDPQYGYQTTFAGRWPTLASTSIHYFRNLTFPYKYHPRYQTLLQQLNSLPDFPLYWEASEALRIEASSPPQRAFTYHHPLYGPLSYIIYAEKKRTAVGDVYLTTLNPQNDPTADQFAELAAELEAILL